MAEFSPDIGNTITQLLGRTAALTAENRLLRANLGRLLAALGIDPASDSVEDAVEVAEALTAFYADSLADEPQEAVSRS